MRDDREPGGSRRGLRRLGGGLLALALGVGGVIALLLFFNARDGAGIDRSGQGVAGGAAVPGAPFDGASELLTPAQMRLLAAGDVFLLYSGARAPAALVALREELSGPPDPALEAAGQAVILLRSARAGGVTALAWRRTERVADPADPALKAFAGYWLGRGASQ